MCDSEFACPVDGNEEVQLAFSGLDLRDIEMKEPDRGASEALASGLVSLDVRPAGISRDAEGSDAGRSVSDGECWPAGHKGSHPAVATYVGEMPRSLLRPPRAGPLSAALWDLSSDLRHSDDPITFSRLSG
ncbi:hypothetical protein NBRC3257_0284 [Gluconobacter thailandicus NBRC 3257]|uniref:Uncharacterized protein n=1 Tax=Gluconobacter thailandicus NBRC 3257 TaxID=1381097 RepID=A0ABQ0IST7_GLUTH|nr:hypothetical protein NBRC3257_0284 [Gluconobacter thailandicus NBRC 3257]